MRATSDRRPWPLFLGGLVVLVLLSLGIWQVQRLAWKTDLIARTEAALAAAPVAAPSPDELTAIASYEYARVTISGRYLPGPDTQVMAVTERGSGDWVMTGFETDAGWRLMVNRGFVADGATAAAAPDGQVTLTGLMRASQTGGAFLRDNDPDGGRWFSRDTQAIARTAGLGDVAPWFLDLQEPSTEGYPIAGMTVVSFPNHHLQYALTWFAMAAGLMVLMWRLGFAQRRKD